jgi:hypothetical protein
MGGRRSPLEISPGKVGRQAGCSARSPVAPRTIGAGNVGEDTGDHAGVLPGVTTEDRKRAGPGLPINGLGLAWLAPSPSLSCIRDSHR